MIHIYQNDFISLFKSFFIFNRLCYFSDIYNVRVTVQTVVFPCQYIEICCFLIFKIKKTFPPRKTTNFGVFHFLNLENKCTSCFKLQEQLTIQLKTNFMRFCDNYVVISSSLCTVLTAVSFTTKMRIN